MGTERIRKPTAPGHTTEARHGVSERVVRTSFPRRAWPFVRLHWKPVLQLVLVLAGLVVQVGLILMVEGLVDLTLSLMEVWAELARKHLELTL